MKVQTFTSFEKTEFDRILEKSQEENITVREFIRKAALAALNPAKPEKEKQDAKKNKKEKRRK